MIEVYLANKHSIEQSNTETRHKESIRQDLPTESRREFAQDSDNFPSSSGYEVIQSNSVKVKTLPYNSVGISDLTVHDLDITQHPKVYSRTQILPASELIRGVTHGGVIKTGNVNIPLDDYNI